MEARRVGPLLACARMDFGHGRVLAAAHSLRRGIASASYALIRSVLPGAYAQDGLVSVHAHEFQRDADFRRAYARGVRALGGTDTHRWHWRVHVGLWAARAAAQLEGDFIECGVNRGFLSSAIMELLDWNALDRDFYLLDTFAGMDARFVSKAERARGTLQKNAEHLRRGFYVRGVEGVRANFAQWPRARIIVGAVPETLEQVRTSRVAFLHLDMNCAPPEVAAARHLWDRLSPGAPVLFDDYAFFGCTEQRLAIDEFARERGVAVCALPTGQGLILKPPRR